MTATWSLFSSPSTTDLSAGVPAPPTLSLDRNCTASSKLREMRPSTVLIHPSRGEDLRIESHLLKASRWASLAYGGEIAHPNSKVFRDMLDVKEDPNDPIPLEYDAFVITALLKFIDFDTKLDDIPTYSSVTLVGLIRLSLQFEFGIALERLALKLHKVAEIRPASAWTVFMLASNLDDIHLARRAICAMEDEEWLWEGKWTEARVVDVLPRYYIALFRACDSVTNNGYNRARLRGQVAERFSFE